MILIDYSQIALSNILPFQNDIKRQSADEIKNLIRHTTLSTIKSYKKRYGKEYGELVIACDGSNYWRRQVFPHYKAMRKVNREKSDLDWGLIFDTLGELRQDLIDHFPYRVLHVNGAEADDVIAVMAKWSQSNQLLTEGLFEEPQKMLIVSSDKDFIQLQKYKNVRQWSPMQKKFVQGSQKMLSNTLLSTLSKEIQEMEFQISCLKTILSYQAKDKNHSHLKDCLSSMRKELRLVKRMMKSVTISETKCW